jgi:hypothetical protein
MTIHKHFLAIVLAGCLFHLPTPVCLAESTSEECDRTTESRESKSGRLTALRAERENRRLEHDQALFLTRARHATAYANGNVSAITKNAFWSLYWQTSTTPCVAKALEVSIPAMDNDDFQVCQQFEVTRVLQKNGQLRLHRVESLHLRRDSEPIARALRQITGQWSMLVASVREGSVPEASQIRKFQDQVDRLTELVREQTGDQADLPARLALSDVESIRKLSCRLHDPDYLHDLGWCVGAHSFPGGTLSDLLLFLSAEPVVPRPTTPAALALGELNYKMVGQGAMRVGLDVPAEAAGKSVSDSYQSTIQRLREQPSVR